VKQQNMLHNDWGVFLCKIARQKIFRIPIARALERQNKKNLSFQPAFFGRKGNTKLHFK